METSSIPGGTLRITLANASQYVIMGLFYIVVTKTNALTQTDIGVLSILNFLASTFSLLTVLALPTALTKFTSEKLGRAQRGEAAAIHRTIIRTVLALSVAGFAIAALLSQMLSEYLWSSPEFTLLIVLALVNAVLLNTRTLCRSNLQALYLFGRMAIVSFTFILSSRAIAIVLAMFHMGVQGVLVGYICGSLIALTLAITFLRGKLPRTTKNVSLKPLLSFSLPLFASSLTLLILEWADVVIITSLTADYALTGVYYIAIRSLSTLSVLWLPLTTTIFPALSAHYGLDDPQSISHILKTSSRYLVYVIVPSCVGLAIIAPTALSFFYGTDYARGATPMTILSIAAIIIALYSLLTTTLTAIGKTGQILKINFISAVSTILMLVALVPLLEAVGAAFAQLITRTIGLLLGVYLLRREINVQLDKEALWKSAIASAATIPLLLALELIMSPRLSTPLTLALEILSAAAIYLISLYMLKALKRQDFALLKQALPQPLGKYIDTLERIIVR